MVPETQTGVHHFAPYPLSRLCSDADQAAGWLVLAGVAAFSRTGGADLHGHRNALGRTVPPRSAPDPSLVAGRRPRAILARRPATGPAAALAASAAAVRR